MSPAPASTDMTRPNLHDLTQSKLEHSLSARRNSMDLRRLVLLTNAAFTSSWSEDDQDNQLTEEELQRWKEQEWFDQLMGGFLEEEDEFEEDSQGMSFLHPGEEHVLLQDEPGEAEGSSVPEDNAAPWSIPLPLSPRSRPHQFDEFGPLPDEDLPDLSYSPTSSPPGTPPSTLYPHHPPMLFMRRGSTDSETAAADWDVHDYGLVALFAQQQSTQSTQDCKSSSSMYSNGNSIRHCWRPPVMGPASVRSQHHHHQPQSRLIDGLLLSYGD